MRRAFINIGISLLLFLLACDVQFGLSAAHRNPEVPQLLMFWVLSPVVTGLFLYHAFGMMWLEGGALAFKSGEDAQALKCVLAGLAILPVVIVLFHVGHGATAEHGVKLAIAAIAFFASMAALNWTFVLYRAVRDGTAHNHAHVRWSR